MYKKNLLLIFLLFFFTKNNYGQEIDSRKHINKIYKKVELYNESFKSSFVYSISSKTKSNFTISISSKRNKEKIITKTHKNIIGKKFFKVDVSTLKKGSYYFKILENELKVVFEKKIKKL